MPKPSKYDNKIPSHAEQAARRRQILGLEKKPEPVRRMGTVTGRFSARGPRFEQIPREIFNPRDLFFRWVEIGQPINAWVQIYPVDMRPPTPEEMNGPGPW